MQEESYTNPIATRLPKKGVDGVNKLSGSCTLRLCKKDMTIVTMDRNLNATNAFTSFHIKIAGARWMRVPQIVPIRCTCDDIPKPNGDWASWASQEVFHVIP